MLAHMTIKQAIELYRLAKSNDGMQWQRMASAPVIKELKIENYVDFTCRAVPIAVYKLAEEFNKNL